MFYKSDCPWPAVVGLAAGFVMLGTSGAKAGFFDELFGGATSQPAIQAPQVYAPSQPDNLGYNEIRPAVHRHKARVAAAAFERTPNLQKTTDLMSDRTLRVGDAVMTKTGLNIYQGPEASHHDADEFVPLTEARHVPAQARTELAALDVAHRPPLKVASLDTSAEGRSSASGQPISVGYRITDARGQSVRYVGP